VSQVSVVQRLPSSQTIGVPEHAPSEHVSPVVQAFRSTQGAVLLAWTHPAMGSQLSSVQGLLSLQLSALPGRHVPKVHVSPSVHAFPSLQAAVLLLKTQPVAGSQLSVVHSFWSSQVTGVPTHAPPEHPSCEVQAFPSVQTFVLYV
jgi:hypothetical protein